MTVRDATPHLPAAEDQDDKHRLVCRRCGHTEDVGCVIGDQPCLAPAQAAGFAVDAAEVVFWGLCPACKG